MRKGRVFMMLSAALALVAYGLVRQDAVLVHRIQRVEQLNAEIRRLEVEISRLQERRARLEHEIDYNLAVARDKMNLVRAGERLLLLEYDEASLENSEGEEFLCDRVGLIEYVEKWRRTRS